MTFHLDGDRVLVKELHVLASHWETLDGNLEGQVNFIEIFLQKDQIVN